MKLTGFHHLTAVTANTHANLDFYTQSLGLRLIKKTVNQDDVSSYHLFYGDGNASPGTDITFFDWPMPKERRGNRSIIRTGLRVDSPETLNFWAKRFHDLNITNSGITTRANRPTLDFEDHEGQRLSLAVDDRKLPNHPWQKPPIPAEHQIRGLGPIAISIPELAPTEHLLTTVMNMRKTNEYTQILDGSTTSQIHIFEVGDGGPSAELHVAIEPHLQRNRLGAGGVHHVAFRIPTFEEYDAWNIRLQELNVATSGPVNRFYFRSLYFREPSGILFELATDGPGFATDEPLDHLGEHLSLPPFLEPQRQAIEAGLKPLDTSETRPSGSV